MEQQDAASLAAEYLVFQGGDTSESPIQLALWMKLEEAQALGIDVWKLNSVSNIVIKDCGMERSRPHL